ncbi:MAG: hypothetical protein CSB33_04750 [Desulfobacterales bacterium]|nr:MAG: hypothetical protein CSB33_04750 [Desulfobacterales bacterium]
MKTIVKVVIYGFVFAVFVSCAGSPETKTIRIHNSAGLSNRPADYAPHDASANDVHEEKRISALVSLAEKDPRAAYDLGLRYFRGDGVRQDSYQAIQWMRTAAERGNLDAQKALGRLYLTGLEEMGPDPQEAEKWLLIASSRGDKASGKLLKEASEARKKERDYHRWKTFWQKQFYRSWNYGYPYRYYWRYGRWYY